MPAASRFSISTIDGASRISSVLGLKARPQTAIMCGAEDLHLIGIPELADNIVSLMSKNGPTGEIKAALKKRLRFEFNQ